MTAQEMIDEMVLMINSAELVGEGLGLYPGEIAEVAGVATAKMFGISAKSKSPLINAMATLMASYIASKDEHERVSQYLAQKKEEDERIHQAVSSDPVE